MSAPVLTTTWSDFLRNASDIADRLPEGDILLRRRDGEDVRLTLEHRVLARPAALDLFARLIEVALTDRNGARHMSERLADALPWARFLPEEDRHRFLGELASCVEACASVDNWVALDQLIEEWKHSAVVFADPGNLTLLTRAHTDDFGPVVPPATG